jgi:O-antigen/teichoic acid export membrane protein
MNGYLRLMKIFEVLWLVVAVIALVLAVTKGLNGESYGSYVFITIFTAGIAYFMYRFKKKNRKYLESYYKKKEQEQAAGKQ